MADRTIDDLLAGARARLHRVAPAEAFAAMAAGVPLVDIRSSDQRRADGVIDGAIWYPRNVLEWRFDRASGHADPALVDRARPAMLLCAEGYQTSLAAATLHDLGFEQATDVVDGFAGWRAAGLPFRPFDEAVDLREGSARDAADEPVEIALVVPEADRSTDDAG